MMDLLSPYLASIIVAAATGVIVIVTWVVYYDE